MRLRVKGLQVLAAFLKGSAISDISVNAVGNTPGN